jgi:hypothetical protein
LVVKETDVSEQTTDRRGGTLGYVAEAVGQFLGEAVKLLMAWNGPRDVLVKTLVEVRDRASAMLVQMGVEEGGQASTAASAGKSNEGAGPVE